MKTAHLSSNVIDCFDGQYAFLSNFYPSTIIDEDNDLVYPTVEHAFQAAKTPSMEEAIDIAMAKTPGLAKRLGRKSMLRPDWEEVKDSVMLKCLREKFAKPELKEKLLATGDAYLIEGNTWHDNYWGICHCVKCQDIVGKNHLGKMLMKLREELKGV